MADANLAQLGFNVNTGGLARGERAMNNYATTGEKTERRVDGSVSNMNSSFMSLKSTIGAVSAALVVMAAKSGFDTITSETSLLQRNLLKTEALIKSTGKAGLISADELHESAQRFARSTLESTEGVMQAQTLMLTFKKIGVDSYSEVTETALNLSRVTGGDLKSSMLQLGKALEDPVLGMSAMSRSGVSFSQAQKDMSKELVATGDILGAQRLILDELASQYGGVAVNEAMELAGSQDNLSQSIQEFNLALDESMGLSESSKDAYNSMSEATIFLTNNVDSLVSAGKVASAVIGIGLVASLGKSAASMITVAASTVAYNIRLAQMSGLTGAYAVQAGVAAVATNALGVATRFLLGPWGLLLTAISAGIAAFISSKSKSDALTESIKLQETEVDKLAKSYGELANADIASAYVRAHKQMMDIDSKRIALREKAARMQEAGTLNTYTFMPIRREMDKLDESAKKSELSMLAINKIIEDGFDAIKWKNASDEINKALESYEKWLDKVSGYRTPMQKLADEIIKVNKALAGGDLKQSSGVSAYLAKLNEEMLSLTEKTEKAKEKLDGGNEYQDWLNQVTSETNIGKLQALRNEILRVNEAMMKGDLSSSVGNERLSTLGEEMANIGNDIEIGNPFDEMIKGARDAGAAMSGMFKDGSKDAQRLAVAMSALNLISAVGAVLNQGKGDPYTAFGRMAAMASAVAAMGVSVNTAFGSDLEDRSGEIQSSQGMNQWGEKATSMDDSLSIVANATNDLVGINSGMLSALQNMQMSIGGASGMIARDVTTPSINSSDLGLVDLSSNIIDPFRDTDFAFIGDWVGVGITKYLSGESNVANEGVRIIGGALGDLLGDVTVQAFQTVDYKKWKYGSTKSKTEFKNVEDSVNQQFSLVFNSLADAAMSGAMALGLDAKNAAESINNLVLDTISISTKGLKPEEQAEAFNNVFSQVFNDMTKSVVPWLSELQIAGEDLGTTLARVSTQVSIADLMVDRFGVTFGSKLANPEMYAKAADNLSTLVGGVEQLSSLTSSFIDNFASDEMKLSIHTDALTESMSAVGLELPKTASGMWDLMNGLDATTSAGSNQISTLLMLGDTADEYYSMLGKQNEAMASLSDSFASAVLDIYNLSDGVSQVGLDAAVTAARFGDFSLAEQLDLSDYKLDTSDFSSASEFNIAQAEAANKILEISQLSANAANDVQTKQLDTLNSINASIIEAQKTTNELLIRQNELQQNSSDNLDQLVNA